MGSFSPISRIAIIGAGPTGVCFAKYLLAEKCFATVDIFEQRSNVGGVWNLSSAERTKRIPIPQQDPRYGSVHYQSQPNGVETNGTLPDSVNNDSLEFESPLYDYLEANIPKEVMQFSDVPFPDHYPLYPSHQECLEYIERYSDDVTHMIRFETQIQNVKLCNESSSAGQDKWEVTFKNLKDGSVNQDVYDAVVVANGHYTVPEIRAVSGMAEWNRTYPRTIMHSKAYRKPEWFAGQKVIVVGNSASGMDIAFQIGPFSSHLYLSSRSESMFDSGKASWKEDIDEIVEFLPPGEFNRAVKTKSGKIVDNVDAIIFATGYFYSFPFLSELDPPLISDGHRTEGTYEHLFYIEHPTMVLPVLNIKIVPFALAENQAAVVARVWSGRLPTPSKDKMQLWEAKEIEWMGSGKYFHLKKFPAQPAQLNELYRWASSATPRKGLENDGVGKLGQHYDQRKVWLRSKMMDIKMVYMMKGDQRRDFHTVEGLGYNYEEWLKSAKPEDMKMFKEAKCFD